MVVRTACQIHLDLVQSAVDETPQQIFQSLDPQASFAQLRFSTARNESTAFRQGLKSLTPVQFQIWVRKAGYLRI